MRRAAVALACALLPGLAAAEASPGARRFALVMGVNDGGPSRLRLRYAASDARAMAQVLGQLGGVADGDMLLLVEPDRARIFARFDELARRLAEARGSARRLELILYYSGHSDEEGLLVRGERIAYTDLRDRLDALPADIRVAVLDSCASGALTRTKGGAPHAPFLLDASTSLKGHAFLTSSAADEVAQESDRVGGSFFTHYLLSAMRGAADVTRSGRVTLTDAYGFAFQETLSRTQRTQGGAQHPSYDIQLQGTGDLVLTDLRSTSAGLVLAKDVAGRVYVHDQDDRLVVELRKFSGRDIELGLARGPYRIAVEESGSVSETRVFLEDGHRGVVVASALRPVGRELAMARGVPRDEFDSGPKLFRGVPVALSILPSAALGVGKGGGWLSDDTTNSFALNLTVGRGGGLSGAEFSVLGSWRQGDVSGAQFAIGGNYTEGRQSGFALSDVFNLVGRDFSGVQLSGAGNWVNGGMSGWQSAFGFNHAGGVSKGYQGATGANLASSLTGVQTALAFNSALEMTGTQLAIGANNAGRLSGAQIAAGANVAEDVAGVQLGLVNVGRRVSGLQVGLVNVAQSSSASIGLVNFISDGTHDIAGEYSELGAAVVGRLGGRRVYTLLYLGATTEKGMGLGTTHLGFGGVPVAGLGLGLHLEVGGWSVDPELLGRHLYGTEAPGGEFKLAWWQHHVLTTARVSLGVPISSRVRFVFGPSLNVFFDFDKSHRDFATGWTIENPGYLMKIWPGAFAGIRL